MRMTEEQFAAFEDVIRFAARGDRHSVAKRMEDLRDLLVTEPAKAEPVAPAPSDLLASYDDGSTVYLDSYSGGAAPEGAWGTIRLRFVAADGTETVRNYRAAEANASPTNAAPSDLDAEVKAVLHTLRPHNLAHKDMICANSVATMVRACALIERLHAVAKVPVSALRDGPVTDQEIHRAWDKYKHNLPGSPFEDMRAALESLLASRRTGPAPQPQPYEPTPAEVETALDAWFDNGEDWRAHVSANKLRADMNAALSVAHKVRGETP